MDLNDLLRKQNIDPEQVLVLRHRPPEAKLNAVLPQLAEERPDLFDAYQRNQDPKLEKALTTARYVASFIRHGSDQALFIGLYEVTGSTPLSFAQFSALPEIVELKQRGMEGPKESLFQPHRRWFDLKLLPFYSQWKGRLVVGWPPPPISWWRRADKNEFSVHFIHEERQLVPRPPQWDELKLTWHQLATLPTSWRIALSQWRGIYFIFDKSDGKGYVGSASGNDNILGRWEGYAASGHGGNKLLKFRVPGNFEFTILQLVAQNMPPAEVIQIENTWKERLHTRMPFGLNEN